MATDLFETDAPFRGLVARASERPARTSNVSAGAALSGN